MALTSTTVFDINGQTQTITFNNPTQVDQISYTSSGITFATTAGFNLSKSDTLLYFKFLQVFYATLLSNFPSIAPLLSAAVPLSTFQMNETSAGVTHLYYVQTSQGATVYNNNYVPVAASTSFSARSQVTITLQEFALALIFKQQWNTQVSFN